MNKVFKFAMFALVGLTTLGLTACGDDEPGGGGGSYGTDDLWVGTASTPKYAADAAIYNVSSSASCPFSSIELTESGDYIVTPVNAPRYAKGKATGKKSIFRKAAKDTRALSSGQYYTGTYTKNGDGSFTLKNLGKLSFKNNMLSLELNDGTDYEVPATKETPTLDANELNLRFCRTWVVTGAKEFVYDSNGKQIDSYTYSTADLQEEFVKSVIVTRVGSYIQWDWDDELEDKGTWSWVDKSIQQFRWSDNEGDYGIEQVAFDGNNAKFFETETGYDEDYGGTITYKLVVFTKSK